VLIGAKVAGIVGALAAIPIAGAIQVLLVDWQRHRRRRSREDIVLGEAPLGGSDPAPVEPGAAARG
jgi:hypothetical protein